MWRPGNDQGQGIGRFDGKVLIPILPHPLKSVLALIFCSDFSSVATRCTDFSVLASAVPLPIRAGGFRFCFRFLGLRFFIIHDLAQLLSGQVGTVGTGPNLLVQMCPDFLSRLFRTRDRQFVQSASVCPDCQYSGHKLGTQTRDNCCALFTGLSRVSRVVPSIFKRHPAFSRHPPESRRVRSRHGRSPVRADGA